MNAKQPFESRWQRLAERWETDATLPPGLRALIADIVELQAAPVLPPPDLSFLPPLSLANYVRQVGEQLSRLHFPDVSGSLNAAIQTFFRRLDPQQPRLLLESPPLYLTHSPDPLTILTATYVSTVRLLDLNDPTLLQEPARLALTAYDVALAEARRQGLDAADADHFAAGFAETIRSTASMVGRLTVDN